MRVRTSPPAQAPLILVVDDEPQIRDLLTSVLAREGYRVVAHAEGPPALEQVRAGEAAVLVTDLKMPGMSGLDLIQAARGLKPDLGCILITAYASTETAVEALRSGVDDFLPKPFGLDDLRRVVDRVLSRRRMLVQERDALDHARDETERLRRRNQEAEEALATTRRDLASSRRDLLRRVRDLEFLSELTTLLAKEEDLRRMLRTSARILGTRFRAQVTRIEVDGGSEIVTTEHAPGAGMPSRLLTAVGTNLLRRARASRAGVHRDLVLGFGVPLEALAAPLDLATGPAGGILLLRRAGAGESPEDLALLSLVPRALSVGVEAHRQRRAAADSAVQVAARILETLEGRGTLPRGHGQRVSRLAGRIASAMGLSPRLRAVIERAARLHDVGEVSIPEEVLRRQGPLSPVEREVVRNHPAVGARILAPFGEAAAFVRHHHERPDGAGFPDGLRGDDIPVGAGIIGVAEAFDAMTHRRPYRPSRPRRAALQEIASLRGRQFVPQAADALLRVAGEEA